MIACKSKAQAKLVLATFGLTAALSGCASTLPPQPAVSAGQLASTAEYAARELTGYDDGRVYGGVVNPTGTLSGILGVYEGCLVEQRSRTLMVLTGAMEFHQTDSHSAKQHIYSKSLLDDQPAAIIPLGASFTVAGSTAQSLPDYFRLEQAIPAQCSQSKLFLTSTETLKRQ